MNRIGFDWNKFSVSGNDESYCWFEEVNGHVIAHVTISVKQKNTVKMFLMILDCTDRTMKCDIKDIRI